MLEINFSGLLNYLLQRVSLHACIKSPNRIASSTQSELENLTGIRLDNYDNLVRQCTTNNGSYSLVSITFTTEPTCSPSPHLADQRMTNDDVIQTSTDSGHSQTYSLRCEAIKGFLNHVRGVRAHPPRGEAPFKDLRHSDVG